jgi:hypothetical protein
MINSLSPRLGAGGGTRQTIEQICSQASPRITFRWVPDKQWRYNRSSGAIGSVMMPR